MFELNGQELWWIWLVLGVAFVVVEVLVLDLLFLMLAAGTVGALITSLAGGEPWLQIVVFAVLSLLMLGFVRPSALKRLKQAPDSAEYVETLRGSMAHVLEPVSATAGTVKVDGEIWSARTHAGTVLDPGSQVRIEEVDGATLRVAPRAAIDWDSAATDGTAPEDAPTDRPAHGA